MRTLARRHLAALAALAAAAVAIPPALIHATDSAVPLAAWLVELAG